MSTAEERQRIKDILTAHLLRVSLIVSSNLRFPSSFPYDVLGRHVVALAIEDVRLNENGIATLVTVSIHALLDYPPMKASGIGEDVSRRRTEVKEFTSTVQIRATGTAIKDFDDLTFVPPALLISWPKDL